VAEVIGVGSLLAVPAGVAVAVAMTADGVTVRPVGKTVVPLQPDRRPAVMIPAAAGMMRVRRSTEAPLELSSKE
jgi:hypothetical protein